MIGQIDFRKLLEKKLKHILLDATGFQNFQTGVGRYAYNLISRIIKIDTENYYTVLIADYLDKNHPIIHLARTNDALRIKRIHTPVIGPKRDLRFLFLIERYDLYHCLNSNLPLCVSKNSIVTVHDIIYYHFPQFLGGGYPLKLWYYNRLMRHVAARATHIIAVSQATAHDFNAVYQQKRGNKTPITVIHEGVSELAKPTHNPSPLPSIHADYFLYIGEHRPHKNIDRLIVAFERFQNMSSKHKNSALILAGASHPSYQIATTLPRNVRYIGRVSDEALDQLYTHALALCFVSLYEGFGLPILEAMQRGVAVITSNISSMPEIAGDAALLVDPRNVDAIAQAMKILYTSKQVREKYQKAGIQRAQLFNWEDTAKKTINLYKQAYQ